MLRVVDPLDPDPSTGITMGTLTCGSSQQTFVMPDRMLAHVHIAIARKFRDRHSFLLTWPPDCSYGDLEPIWMAPLQPLFVIYGGSFDEKINDEWLEMLAHGAGTANGLLVCDELPSSLGAAPAAA